MTVKQRKRRRIPATKRKLKKIQVDFGGDALKFVQDTCERKRFFPTDTEARAAGSIARCSKPLYTYQCPNCNGWHLTSSRRGKAIEPALFKLFPIADDDPRYGDDFSEEDIENDKDFAAALPFFGSR